MIRSVTKHIINFDRLLDNWRHAMTPKSEINPNRSYGTINKKYKCFKTQTFGYFRKKSIWGKRVYKKEHGFVDELFKRFRSHSVRPRNPLWYGRSWLAVTDAWNTVCIMHRVKRQSRNPTNRNWKQNQLSCLISLTDNLWPRDSVRRNDRLFVNDVSLFRLDEETTRKSFVETSSPSSATI